MGAPHAHLYQPTGSLMINEIEIKNFRGFSQASVSDCRRINILVGDNGSGKTALLEGAFLAAGPSPEIALRARQWRGFQGSRFEGTEEEIEHALWADLFHNFETSKIAHIALRGTKPHTRSVSIEYDEKRVNQNVNRGFVGLLPYQNQSPVKFTWTAALPKRFHFSSSPFIFEGQIRAPSGPTSQVRATFFAANHTYPANEVANRFSKLSRTYEDKKFIEAFGHQFNNIIDLSVEVSAGAAMLFARVKGVSEKVPVSLASGGMNKLAAILLAFSNQPDGVVFVDEVESGFYYKRFPQIWNSFLSFSHLYNVQIFASTHSAECLEAAASLAEEHPDDFCLMRTVLIDGTTRIRRISGDKLAAAKREDIDLR